MGETAQRLRMLEFTAKEWANSIKMQKRVFLHLPEVENVLSPFPQVCLFQTGKAMNR